MLKQAIMMVELNVTERTEGSGRHSEEVEETLLTGTLVQRLLA